MNSPFVIIILPNGNNDPEPDNNPKEKVEKINKTIIAVKKKQLLKIINFNVGKFSSFDKTSIFLLLENIGNGIIIPFSF